MPNNSIAADEPTPLSRDPVELASVDTLHGINEPADVKAERNESRGPIEMEKKTSTEGLSEGSTASDGAQTDSRHVALKPYQGQTQVIPFNNLSKSVAFCGAKSALLQ